MGWKYTLNINTEMNYWMAEKANLSDCHMPLLELIERTSKKGEKQAQDVYHLAGWVSHHNLDIWGTLKPGWTIWTGRKSLYIFHVADEFWMVMLSFMGTLLLYIG